jgi:hypothetical protein
MTEAIQRQIARWISILGHPFVTTMVLIVTATRHYTDLRRAQINILTAALAVLLPMGLFMMQQVRHGKWNNIDASEPAERPSFYVVAIFSTAILAAFFAHRPATQIVARGALGLLALLIIASLLNRRLKISLHVAFATFVAVTLFFVQAKIGALATLFVPALAWARLKMSRHSPIEVLAGGILGSICSLAVRFT